MTPTAYQGILVQLSETRRELQKRNLKNEVLEQHLINSIQYIGGLQQSAGQAGSLVDELRETLRRERIEREEERSRFIKSADLGMSCIPVSGQVWPMASNM